MVRSWLIPVFILFCLGNATGQSAHTIWNNYNTGQKRWVVRNAGQFIYTVCQGQLDFDSAMLYACKMYGAGRLLPYQDGFAPAVSSPCRALIEAGEIKEAIILVDNLPALQQCRSFLDLANYYLHKSGTLAEDLDSAYNFTIRARSLCSKPEMEKWLYDCLAIEGLIYEQKNEPEKSRKIFLSILNACRKKNDSTEMALALQYAGASLPLQDPQKLSYLKESLKRYQRLNQPLKQLEVMALLVGVYFVTDWTLAEPAMEQYLALLKVAGIQHLLYSQYTLAYLNTMRGDLMGSLSYMNQGRDNIQQTGDSALSSLFYIKTGTIYMDMGRVDEAITWFKKALDTRTYQPQVFWYTGVFVLARVLADKPNAQEGLDFIHSITDNIPPNTTYSRMHLYWVNAIFYEALNKKSLAETNYKLFLSLARTFPKEHIHGEFPDAYYRIARFYYQTGRNDLARQYAEAALTVNRAGVYAADYRSIYFLLFRLDSAAGNYRQAMLNHMKYKFFSDSVFSIQQRKQLAEMEVKYDTEKKDKDINFLQQQGKLQQLALVQSGRLRNITLVAAALLMVILFLLYRQYRLKQRSNKMAQKKNEVLQRMVGEKEWLLKEVHHRVKNNLQTIVSLLELQSEYLQDEALSAIHNSQNRIFSMSLIHQKLYQTDNIAAINMKSYILELLDHLRNLYNVGNAITFDVRVKEVSLDVSQAVPIGLILNEAVTNSIKYAFPASVKHPEIIVSLNQHNDRWHLAICDNGIGFTHSPDANGGGLGMKLINALAGDLDGQLTIENEPGTAVKIYFRAERPLMMTSKLTEPLETQTS